MRKAFTTVEMIMSTAIGGLIISVLFWTFYSGSKQRQMGVERLSDIHEASQLLLALRRDVYGASSIIPSGDAKSFKLIIRGEEIKYEVIDGTKRKYIIRQEGGRDGKYGFASGDGRFSQVMMKAGPTDARFIWVDLTLLVMSELIDGQPLDFSTRIWGKSHQNRKGAWVDNP